MKCVIHTRKEHQDHLQEHRLSKEVIFGSLLEPLDQSRYLLEPWTPVETAKLMTEASAKELDAPTSGENSSSNNRCQEECIIFPSKHGNLEIPWHLWGCRQSL